MNAFVGSRRALLNGAPRWLLRGNPSAQFDFGGGHAWLNGHAYQGETAFKSLFSTFSTPSCYVTDSAGNLHLAPANSIHGFYGSDRGQLIEEARTNLLLQSEAFDNAAWTAGSGTSITANYANAPDGTATADRVQITDAANANLRNSTGVTTAASTTYTFSFYVYRVSGTLYLRTATGVGQIDLIDYTSSAPLNTWARITRTFTTQAGSSSTFCYPVAAGSTLGAEAYIWGAQLEAGSFATSYIPTTSASATRAASSIIRTTGLGPAFSIYAEYYADANSRGILRGLPVAAGSYFGMDAASGTITGWYASGLPMPASNSGLNKMMVGSDVLGNFKAVRNGGTVLTSALSDYANATTSIDFGSAQGAGIKLNNYLSSIGIYGSLLSNGQFQALTK